MSGHKRAQLADIAEQVQALDESPLYDLRRKNGYSPVVGEGDPDASVMFIGEAPGAREAETGRPFVGSAGGVLDELLQSIGLVREEVYITSVVKDRPPDNRDPRSREIELYAPLLVRQIEIIQPRVIATLGRFAMDFVLKRFYMSEAGQKIGDVHGKVLEAQATYGKVTVIPLYHPAAVFYNRSLDNTMREDFQVLERFV